MGAPVASMIANNAAYNASANPIANGYSGFLLGYPGNKYGQSFVNEALAAGATTAHCFLIPLRIGRYPRMLAIITATWPG